MFLKLIPNPEPVVVKSIVVDEKLIEVDYFVPFLIL